MRLARVLVLSLSLHLLMGLGLLQVPLSWSLPTSLTQNTAEIEIIEKPAEPEDNRLMVRQTTAPDKLLDENT